MQSPSSGCRFWIISTIFPYLMHYSCRHEGCCQWLKRKKKAFIPLPSSYPPSSGNLVLKFLMGFRQGKFWILPCSWIARSLKQGVGSLAHLIHQLCKSYFTPSQLSLPQHFVANCIPQTSINLAPALVSAQYRLGLGAGGKDWRVLLFPWSSIVFPAVLIEARKVSRALITTSQNTQVSTFLYF